jgi:hypothetical protein
MENAMSAKIRSYLQANPMNRVFIVLALILSCAVTAGFVWLQTDQVIAPPGLRLVDWIWRVFIF